MICGQPACAGVPDADRRRRGPAGEPPPLHRVHDPGAGQRVDHVRSVAGDQDAVAVGLLDGRVDDRSEEHTSELQSRLHLVCRLLLEKKKTSGLMTMSRLDTKMITAQQARPLTAQSL